jgi:general secretion pathway protein B
MSYILDALKRTERERLKGRREPHAPAPAHSIFMYTPALWRRLAWVVLVAGVAGVSAFLISVYLVHGPAALDPRLAQEPASRATPASPPAPSAVPQATTPTPAAIPAEPAPLAAQLPPAAPRAAPKPAPVSKPSAVAAPQRAAAPTAPDVTDDTPWLQDLPEDFRQSLPVLTVNIHVYAPAEERRILYLNNRELRSGDEVQEGLKVEAVVPDGVVLSYQGTRFKLPRPR